MRQLNKELKVGNCIVYIDGHLDQLARVITTFNILTDHHLGELEHVATCLANSGHLGNHRQVVDHKSNLARMYHDFLLSGKWSKN